MSEELHERVQYYAVKLREAEELAAKATSGETRQTWDRITDGYRILLTNIQAWKHRNKN